MVRLSYRTLAVFLFFLLFPIHNGICEVRCIDTEGEAVIVGNDIPSAKVEAVARAKWSAIEQTVGVEVKAQTVVQNMALVDDAVSKQIRGIVTGFKVLREEKRGDTVWVMVNACVEPIKAQEAMSSLAMNNYLAVFIPARKPRVVIEAEEVIRTPSGKAERLQTSIKDEFEETNILSENLIGTLIEQGYKVTDVAPTDVATAEDIEKAVRTGNYMVVRSLMYKFLSNILIIGRIDYTISTRKGEDIGYGMAMPFNYVTVRLTYRIVTKDEAGKTMILAAGTAEGKGMAPNLEDAAANGFKDLTEKLTPTIIEKVSQHIKGIAKRVQVKVTGVTDLNTNFAVKEALQNTAWVTAVEEKGLGDFIVLYPENTVYLANSITQKGNFQIVNFSPLTITVNYRP